MNNNHFFVILAVICIAPTLSEGTQRKAAAICALAALVGAISKHI